MRREVLRTEQAYLKPSGVTTGSSDGTISVDGTDVTVKNISSYAKLASPTFTGTPKSTTAAVATDTTQIATTAYVKDCVPKSIGSATNPVYTNSSGVVTASGSTVGSATQGVYLNEGTITKCKYTVAKSVPSTAVFTDTDNISASSNTSKGYIKFSNGLIINWGTVAAKSAVTFSCAFPSYCRSVICTDYNTGDWSWVNGVSKTGFTNQGYAAYFIAIGY